MARNTSVSLGDHFSGFIEEKVREGRYGSASEVVRAGLRLLEEEEAKLARLKELIAAGEASGPGRGKDRLGSMARANESRTSRSDRGQG